MANAVARELLGATHAVIASLHTAVTALQNQVLELMGVRAEVERLRAQASAAILRADELAEQVEAIWQLVRDATAAVRTQDVRIADLEALEGYGWRAPEVYVPKTDVRDCLPAVPEFDESTESSSSEKSAVQDLPVSHGAA